MPNTYRNLVITASILTISIGASSHAHAENAQKRTLLENLAKSFVNKLSPVYENRRNDEPQALSVIPDGTTLLLKPRVDSFVYEGDIYSIKQNGDIYLALTDVIDVLELAIDYDEDGKTGSGFFLQPEWNINFNFNENTVISRGETYRLNANDLYEEDNILFVRGSSLEQWMNFDFDYDISQQYLNIISAYPLPAVARNERRTRESNLERAINEAKLPRMEQARENFDIDVLDVNLRTRYTRSGPSGRTNRQYTSNVTAQGQVLNHDAYALVTADNDEGIRSARTRFSRQSEDPELLGPLNARFYEFGDVNGADLPLTGNDQIALGFRVNNNPLVNNDFNTTDIEGYSTPGWDVELYRNGVATGSQTIDEDGRYNFENTLLYAGDNDFELVFYGPQGEIRRETLSIPVTADLLKTQKDTYEVSVQLEEEDTYQKVQADDQDRGEPTMTARYNKFIGGNLAYLGLRSRPIEGERINYLGTGVTSLYGGTIFDANFAMDDSANTALQLGARRKIADWNVALNGQWNNDEYVISENTTDPTVLNLSGSALRTFRDIPFGNAATINARTGYQETASGSNSWISELGLAHQINRYSTSNILRHEKLDGFSGQEDRLTNNLSMRANLGKVFLRGGAIYEIKPDSEFDRYFGQVNYQHDYKTSADVTVEHRPETNYSRGRLNVNYRNDYFRTSPYIEVTSDDDLYAGLNVNFSLVDAPGKTLPDITSTRMIGRGIVNAFVYFDKNGNRVYDEGDEALPEVVVESLNSRKRAETDQNGYASLRSMSTSIPTDIVVDENSLPDSFMISGFEGASVFPVAGQTHNFSFPIHLAGEVDGVLYLREKDGSTRALANKSIVLLPIDSPKRDIQEAKAAFDGFFLFSKVPPGRYIMVPQPVGIDDKIANPLPTSIEIGYDGTVLAEKDIILMKGSGFVPYKVTYDNVEDVSGNYNAQYRLEVRKSGQSELGKLLSFLSFKNYADPVLEKFQKIESEEENLEIYTGSQADLHNACSRLSFRGIDCVMNIYLQSESNNKLAMK